MEFQNLHYSLTPASPEQYTIDAATCGVMRGRGVRCFFAQLSNSDLKMSTRVRKYHVLRMLKQADGS